MDYLGKIVAVIFYIAKPNYVDFSQVFVGRSVSTRA
jgi:hypothetical protein